MAVKLVPGVNLIYGVVAAVIVAALGESTLAAAEGVFNGKIDQKKVDNIIDAISEALKNSLLVESLKTYLKQNKNNINDKSSAKEMVKEISKMSKK